MARVKVAPLAVVGEYVTLGKHLDDAVVGYRVASCPFCRTPLARHDYLDTGERQTLVSDRLVPLRDGSFGRSRTHRRSDDFTNMRPAPFEVHCPTRSCESRRIRIDIPDPAGVT